MLPNVGNGGFFDFVIQAAGGIDYSQAEIELTQTSYVVSTSNGGGVSTQVTHLIDGTIYTVVVYAINANEVSGSTSSAKPSTPQVRPLAITGQINTIPVQLTPILNQSLQTWIYFGADQATWNQCSPSGLAQSILDAPCTSYGSTVYRREVDRDCGFSAPTNAGWKRLLDSWLRWWGIFNWRRCVLWINWYTRSN